MGIGRAIGSVLLGLGEGMEKQGAFDLTEQARERAAELQARRDAAIEALRNKNRITEIERTGEVADTNAARDDARGFFYGEKADDRKFRQTKELKSIEFANETALATIRAQLGTQSAQALAKFNADLEAGNIAQVLQDKDGNYFTVTKKGVTNDMGKSGALPWSERRPTEDPEDDDEDLLGAARPTGADGSNAGSLAGAAAGGATSVVARRGAGKGPDKPILSQLATLPPPPDGRVGTVITGPGGHRARWTGKVWELVGNGG